MHASMHRRVRRGHFRFLRPIWTEIRGILSAPLFLVLAACGPGDSPSSDSPASYPQGGLRHLIRVDEPERPVTPTMVQKRIDALVARYPEVERDQLEKDYSEVPIPESLPIIESPVVDDTGLLWAQRYHWDSGKGE